MRSKTAILLLLMFATFLFAADNDYFTITVTVQFLDVSLMQSASHSADYTNWAIGAVAAGATSTQTTGDHIWVNNNSNIVVSFNAWSYDTTTLSCAYGTPTNWTPAAAPGTNQYQLELGKGGASALPSSWSTIIATTNPGNTYYTASASDEDHDLYARFTTPSASSDGCQHKITVEILVTP